MNICRVFLIAASITTLTTVLLDQSSFAQEPGLFGDDPVDRVPLFEALEKPSAKSNESAVRQSRMTVSEIRQARALYRANQRVARLEYNLWMGYQPLRPNWNAVPMMNSRYTHRRVYVPAYVYAR